jgi:putative nucleotidyltransferase with HDIG domain
MLSKEEKMEKLVELGININQISDLDLMLEKVLTEAMHLFSADAGSIYIKEEDKLNFSYSKNETFQKALEPGEKLRYTTFSVPINNKSIAGYVANNGKILNIPDAYNIPKSYPVTFNKSFDELTGYRTKSMLTLPLFNSRKQTVGVLQLINATTSNGKKVKFLKNDEPLVQHFALYAANALERTQMTRTTIMRMISMAELRDPKETGPHVNRVAAYSVEIFEAYAKKKKMAQEEIDAKRDAFRMAAMLHDVGKVAISDTILKKPGSFTNDEYEIMKTHTTLGANLFNDAQSNFDEISAEIALNHHEKWDGTGYPGFVDIHTGKPLPGYEKKDGKARGKREEEIPLYGRIVALADVYDALCSKRVYKEAWTEEKVLETLRKDSGTHFDPELIDVFFDIYDVIDSISKRYPDNE